MTYEVRALYAAAQGFPVRVLLRPQAPSGTWKSMVSALEVKDGAKFASSCSTVDTVRSAWLLDTFSSAGKPCCSWATPAARRCYQQVPRRLGSGRIVLNMNFSSRTTSLDVQSVLEGSVEAHKVRLARRWASECFCTLMTSTAKVDLYTQRQCAAQDAHRA